MKYPHWLLLLSHCSSHLDRRSQPIAGRDDWLHLDLNQIHDLTKQDRGVCAAQEIRWPSYPEVSEERRPCVVGARVVSVVRERSEIVDMLDVLKYVECLDDWIVESGIR